MKTAHRNGPNLSLSPIILNSAANRWQPSSSFSKWLVQGSAALCGLAAVFLLIATSAYLWNPTALSPALALVTPLFPKGSDSDERPALLLDLHTRLLSSLKAAREAEARLNHSVEVLTGHSLENRHLIFAVRNIENLTQIRLPLPPETPVNSLTTVLFRWRNEAEKPFVPAPSEVSHGGLTSWHALTGGVAEESLAPCVSACMALYAKCRHLEEQQVITPSEREPLFGGIGTLEDQQETCLGELWTRCRLRRPSATWQSAHDAVVAANQEIPAGGKEGFPGYAEPQREPVHVSSCDLGESNSSSPFSMYALLRAPEVIWKRDWYGYPRRVNVSFIMQYFNVPQNIHQIMAGLLSCTEGLLAQGEYPGVSTELVVNVDEPSGHAMWLAMMKETTLSRFVTPVFSHNIHETRGYNRIANVAQGRVLVLLQDDELPPPTCRWLGNVLSILRVWPAMGMLGMRGSRIKWFDPEDRRAIHKKSVPYIDPKTNIRMYFPTLVDSAPSIYFQRKYFALGGQQEGIYGKKGESGIFTDWYMAIRMWTAGHLVSLMYTGEREMRFENPPGQKGGTYVGKAGYFRRQGHMVWTDWDNGEVDNIFEEVKRLNANFLKLDQVS
eukprot:TRINITY_DN36022_c0_g1_i1.p1 TRINITY_DN36022_c0_g1~~TRINITY_DN36022_c0_g1_i1.p1  ORF type:complete len:611 (-),score=31.45 TRINITY_DN36022_c0_g1_i1:162-1994(-)